MSAVALILAAGEGVRMRSDKPKVAHELLGRPLVQWPIHAARKAGCQKVIVVLGHGREYVEPFVEGTEVAIQAEQHGTGHAVMCARDLIESALSCPVDDAADATASAGLDRSVVVLSGDSPLIRPETIQSLIEARTSAGASAVVLTMTPPDPHGYGRIIRNPAGALSAIVEEKDCTDAQRALTECNSGIYCFDAADLLGTLDKLSCDNAQGEYYLTDAIGILVGEGKAVLAQLTSDYSEALGVNSRSQLATATKIMQRRINEAHMAAGVTMLDPDLVWIGPDVRIERDVELLPLTFLRGNTQIASGTVVGPNSRLTDCTVGHDCTIDETVGIQAVIDNGVNCGPRAYLRPGTHLCDNSKVGTSVEIKKSTIGEGSKVPHLSYIGDTTMGKHVNIGAGTITCNYDGVHKNATTIGDDAFIGSDTMLVAPVNVGAGVVTGAGSTITDDVPDSSLAIGRARQVNLAGWRRRTASKDDAGASDDAGKSKSNR